MEMDCVFNAVKYCGTLEIPAAVNTCNDALSATFDAKVAQTMPKLEAYEPETKMRKGSWQRNLAMLKENKQSPCPAGLSQAGLSQAGLSKTACRATLKGVNWAVSQARLREVEAAEK